MRLLQRLYVLEVYRFKEKQNETCYHTDKLELVVDDEL